jgi:carbon-monoxide dehydrogenase large subunit
VVDPEAALAPGAPVIFPELQTNRSLAHRWRQGDVEAAFAAASRVVRLRVVQQRLSAVSLEPQSGRPTPEMDAEPDHPACLTPAHGEADSLTMR